MHTSQMDGWDTATKAVMITAFIKGAQIRKTTQALHSRMECSPPDLYFNHVAKPLPPISWQQRICLLYFIPLICRVQFSIKKFVDQESILPSLKSQVLSCRTGFINQRGFIHPLENATIIILPIFFVYQIILI